MEPYPALHPPLRRSELARELFSTNRNGSRASSLLQVQGCQCNRIPRYTSPSVGASLLASFSAQNATARETSSLLQVPGCQWNRIPRYTNPSVGASLLASFSAQTATARETSSLLQVPGCQCNRIPRYTTPLCRSELARELFSANRNSSRDELAPTGTGVSVQPYPALHQPPL